MIRLHRELPERLGPSGARMVLQVCWGEGSPCS